MENSLLGDVSHDEISKALEELENMKLDHKEGAVSNTPDSMLDYQGAFIPRRKKGKKSKSSETIRITLENRLMLNDQITKKIHEKSKNIELENQRLREQIEQMDKAISGQVQVSELLRRLDEQEVVIQELTSYCESLETKCEQLENTHGSKDHHDKTSTQLKVAQQKLMLLDGKYETLKKAYEQLLSAKIDRFISNSKSTKKTSDAKKKVPDMSQELITALKDRINSLMHERNMEQNMHNSIAFELEAQVAKWYSECKMYKQQLELLKKSRPNKDNPLNYVI